MWRWLDKDMFIIQMSVLKVSRNAIEAFILICFYMRDQYWIGLFIAITDLERYASYAIVVENQATIFPLIEHLVLAGMQRNYIFTRFAAIGMSMGCGTLNR